MTGTKWWRRKFQIFKWVRENNDTIASFNHWIWLGHNSGYEIFQRAYGWVEIKLKFRVFKIEYDLNKMVKEQGSKFFYECKFWRLYIARINNEYAKFKATREEFQCNNNIIICWGYEHHDTEVNKINLIFPMGFSLAKDLLWICYLFSRKYLI